LVYGVIAKPCFLGLKQSNLRKIRLNKELDCFAKYARNDRTLETEVAELVEAPKAYKAMNDVSTGSTTWI
jgi:hypothetical protein